MIIPPRKARSVPGRIGAYRLAIEADLVKPGVYNDQLRPSFFHGLQNPPERSRMVFSGIAAYHEYYVRVFDVNPVVRHCTPAEGSRQTGDCCGVSNSCLVFQIGDAECPHEF